MKFGTCHFSSFLTRYLHGGALYVRIYSNINRILIYAADSKSVAERHGGSSPSRGTISLRRICAAKKWAPVGILLLVRARAFQALRADRARGTARFVPGRPDSYDPSLSSRYGFDVAGRWGPSAPLTSLAAAA